MKLSNIKAIGFRSCFDINIDINNLTVLIGENDSGKSSILELLDIVINNKSPQPNDFFCSANNKRVDKIEVQLMLLLDEKDEYLLPFSINNVLCLKKIYSITGEVETFVYVESAIDSKFDVDFVSISAEEQKELLLSLNSKFQANQISNKTKRQIEFEKLMQIQPKQQKWKKVPNNFGRDFIYYERYSAIDYIDPSSIVSKTFRQIFLKTIYQENANGISVLVPQLLSVQKKASEEISKKVAELSDFIKKYCSQIKNIDYNADFDFSGGLRTGEFLIDRGFGFHPLSRIGDGSKRRLSMAVIDWDRQVLSAKESEEKSNRLIIRGYDEPDTNLHYEAQRFVFYSISELAETDKTGIQAILCTHSLTMIDRASAKNIRLFSIDDNGCTKIRSLETNNDPEIEEFLKVTAAELGITNSIMFYERCFIIIEGDTEYNALPIIYRKKFGRSLIEDGIRLINVKSNSGVHPFLKLFINNNRELLLIFIDSDSRDRRDLKLTEPFLRELGFNDDFFNNQLKYIGDQEFEDCFTNEIIIAALNKAWPKNDGQEWHPDEIQSIRNGKKFSEELSRIVWENTNDGERKWTKPEFGKILAEVCPVEQLPKGIIDLFSQAQKIIN